MEVMICLGQGCLHSLSASSSLQFNCKGSHQHLATFHSMYNLQVRYLRIYSLRLKVMAETLINHTISTNQVTEGDVIKTYESIIHFNLRVVLNNLLCLLSCDHLTLFLANHKIIIPSIILKLEETVYG